MGSLRLHTTLQARGPAAAIVLDDAQVATLGDGAKVFPVSATINGVTWAGRVARMGGESLLGLSRSVRTSVGAKAGDVVQVEITLDTAPREVEVPPALAAALDAEPGARAAFDALSFTARKEHARAVAEAKQDTTRERRVAKILASL